MKKHQNSKETSKKPIKSNGHVYLEPEALDLESSQDPSEDFFEPQNNTKISSESEEYSDKDSSEYEHSDDYMTSLQRDLAEIPFEKLLEVQRKYGTDNQIANNKEHEKTLENRLRKNNHGPQKRAHKNRPMEITSKKPVGRFRQIVELSAEKRRDPRFDNISGKLNQDLFEKSYHFLNDYKTSEIKAIQKEIKNEKDLNEKERLQKLLSKLEFKTKSEQLSKQRKELKHERKKAELERVTKGKKPFYLKKSTEKRLELIEKFKKTDPKALEKLIEKRRKKNAAKEHKHIPFKRRKVE
ncbi:hypothetical protein G9A89_012040 [Geosiphon pyriformis]|nr:hypothetical protein G9A89_012040 [Geosiphon pyriformis]